MKYLTKLLTRFRSQLLKKLNSQNSQASPHLNLKVLCFKTMPFKSLKQKS